MSVYEIYDKTVKKNKRKNEMLTMQNIAHLLGKREGIKSENGSQEPTDLKQIL